MRLFPILISVTLAAGLAASRADAGEAYGYHRGRLTPTTYTAWDSNHTWKGWSYPSTFPWATTVTYNAGPGNYYPAYHARIRQARRGHRWTGYPPRHFYIVDYNGYAPPYGYGGVQ